jgi:hypothetical protein
MIRTGLAATGVLATLALAACSSTSAATNTGSTSPSASPSGNARRGGGTAGELVRIAGSSLLLNTTTGDVSVALQTTTPLTRTRTGSVADITKGSCITATGTKDAAGTLTAATVLLSPAVNGSCAAPFGGNGNGGLGGARPSQSPGASPRPSPSGTPPAFARGQVTTVNGTAVSLQDAQGGALTITVPTTVRVGVSQAITTADLAVGDCVVANGQKDSAGVVQARSISVVPPSANGCSAAGGFGGFGGRGGFGGGGGGGGAGGAGGAGAPAGGGAGA